MEDKLFKILDDLNIKDTNLLLDKDMNLSVDYFIRKRIEKCVKKKVGYYSEDNILIQKINNILGGIFMKRKIALTLSACAILSLGGGATYAYAAKTPVAYVSVDINPSVELGVNAFDKVISVEAYNEDGQKVLEGTDLINYEVNNAVNAVVTNAISDGYIHDDGSSLIEITTATDKDKIASKLEESLKDATNQILDNNDVQADVKTDNVAIARRDEARKLGLTPGKLNLIQKLQELDPTIKIEDYKSSSVKDIQNKTKELKEIYKHDEVTTDDTANDITDTNPSDDIVTDENSNNSFNNNGSIKKEENSNSNNKEENNNANNKEKGTTPTPEKQNNNSDLNSQSKNNSNSQNKNNDKEKSKNN